MPVQVEVPSSEWSYIYPLKEITNYMKKHAKDASRHDVTRWLGILEDYAMEGLSRAAAVARVLQDFERRFGFSDDKEREHVGEMVKRVAEKIFSIRWKEPEKLSQFIKTLRSAVLGMFFGLIDPVLLTQNEAKKR